MAFRTLMVAGVIATALASPLAGAADMDSLKQSASDLMNSSSESSQGTTGGATALLGQLSSGSFNLASPQNVVGVLGYCQKQGYSESATSQVKNQLLNKLGGEQQVESNDGYQRGLSGLLMGDSGQSFSLAGLKDRIGQRVCQTVADRAMSSFLGG